MRAQRTEVLVIGAGPVGLLTAILLAESGIEVQIIDKEDGTAARSYACALHPRALKLLGRLGLADAILDQGRRIPKLAFYEGESRCAEIKFSEIDGDFPFLLVLPQSALEGILEQRLHEKTGMKVKWNHRFDGIEREDENVIATVEKLEGTAMGYIVPHWETVVQKRFPIRAQFLVGADGHSSLVRQRLGIEHDRLAGAQAFVVCEFSSDKPAEDEVRVVLDDRTTNVLWPLPGKGHRWTFQMVHGDMGNEFPEKDRRAMASEEALNEQIRGSLQKIIRHRAPWFSAEIREIAWCKQVVFEHRLSKQFGRNRCWLAGDAAHQTGPVGMQSMNVGLCEAEALAGKLQKILREKAPLDLLAAYDRERQNEWRELLGLPGGLRPRSETNAWVRSRGAKILPCLPASGQDLKLLANQLGLDTGQNRLSLDRDVAPA